MNTNGRKPGESHIPIIIVAVTIAALSKVAEEVVHHVSGKFYDAQDKASKAAKTQKKSKKKPGRRRRAAAP